MDEFDLIKRLLAPLATATPGAFNLTNDAAVISPPAGHDLVVTKDMMASGVHFLPDDPPDLIARKLLRVNLSDLAAMGAAPLGYLVGAGFSEAVSDAWIDRFVDGLKIDQTAFGIGLLGGDTISVGTSPLVLSLTALGSVPHGATLIRSGAQPGDLLAVSGTLGDAALGLRYLRDGVTVGAEDQDYVVDRYRLPRPRVDLGVALRGRATAVLDISDGLVADTIHLSEESEVAIRIDATRLPLSDPIRRLLERDPSLLVDVLTGGDDYELLFAIGEADLEESDQAGVAITVIGEVTEGRGVKVFDASGDDITPGRAGWRHGKSSG